MRARSGSSPLHRRRGAADPARGGAPRRPGWTAGSRCGCRGSAPRGRWQAAGPSKRSQSGRTRKRPASWVVESRPSPRRSALPSPTSSAPTKEAGPVRAAAQSSTGWRRPRWDRRPARSRPSRSRATRSATASASSTSCVACTAAAPSAWRRRRHLRLQLALERAVEVGGGLVEQVDGRPARQGACQADALLLAARELRRSPVGQVADAQLLEQLRGPAPAPPRSRPPLDASGRPPSPARPGAATGRSAGRPWPRGAAPAARSCRSRRRAARPARCGPPSGPGSRPGRTGASSCRNRTDPAGRASRRAARGGPPRARRASRRSRRRHPWPTRRGGVVEAVIAASLPVPVSRPGAAAAGWQGPR